MSLNIKITNLTKRFGDNTVIPNLDAVINNGELFTLLGPSGCGKTTLLRMIAGFNSIEGGTIYFENKKMNSISPHKRNIGMVFQNYAIFPHLSVKDNVAFGLKNKKIKKENLNHKIDEILKIVKIHHLKDRMPSEMSGGQQQRLALARAIVVQPDVLLMDEPLSNLDAKLRVEMREAIKEIQKKFKITTVYVTHDQEEALSISDRIAIMNEGVIQQIGSPKEIYLYPKNLFVATFIGQSVILNGELIKKDDKCFIELENKYLLQIPNKNYTDTNKAVKLLIRPNEFEISDDGYLKGKVLESFFLGTNIQYNILLENNQKIQILDADISKDIKERDEIITLKFQPFVFNLFDASTGMNLAGEEE